MKIIINDCVYVQRIDISNLFRENLSLPNSVYIKYFEEDNEIFGSDTYNMYDFIKFDDLDSISYFKQMDCIVDYNDIKDLSAEEIMKLGKSIAEKSDIIGRKINSAPNDSDKNMIMYYKLLNFKIRSLCDAYKLKTGSIKIKSPKEINKSDDSSNLRTGIKKITKSIFRNRKSKTNSRLD